MRISGNVTARAAPIGALPKLPKRSAWALPAGVGASPSSQSAIAAVTTTVRTQRATARTT